MKDVAILGAGPAGSSAAIAASREGARVRLYDRSRFPRHKVCGEFLSPEIAPALDKLGVWDRFLAAGPARVRRMALHFGAREKAAPLPEVAYGLSRYAFDQLLIQASGATLQAGAPDTPAVIATGRRATATRRGRRLFGFKAHFDGPQDDAVELYFLADCYVGVNAIEGGRTNVCGLASEEFLRSRGFDYDALLDAIPALRARLRPMNRSMDWLSTGPLEFRQRLRETSGEYLAGDALSFVDPFTGSGLVAAVKTGAIAGSAAARGARVGSYARECRDCLKRPFEVSSLLRRSLNQWWTPYAATFVPARLLFAHTRPK